jgi:hypothetical protein
MNTFYATVLGNGLVLMLIFHHLLAQRKISDPDPSGWDGVEVSFYLFGDMKDISLFSTLCLRS